MAEQLLLLLDQLEHAITDSVGWVWWAITTVPAALVIALVVWFYRYFGRRKSLQPVRTAYRRAVKNLPRKSTERRELRAVKSALSEALRQNAEMSHSLPVALEAHRIIRLVGYDEAQPPFDSPVFSQLLGMARSSLEPMSLGLGTRYLLMDRWESHAEWLKELADHLGKFENLGRVSLPSAKEGESPLFCDAVSAMTGVSVLADFAVSAAGCADNVAVWHQASWDGREAVVDPDALEVRRWGPYATAKEFAGEDVRLGRYNGRVPTLHRVEVRQHPGSDGATLVLVTGEADYLGTELPRKGAPQVATECKSLAPSLRDVNLPRFRPLGSSSSRLLGATRMGASSGKERAIQLNGKMGLISWPTDDARYFVLMNRSAGPNHGARLLGTASGGVIEMAVPHDGRDSSTSGALDPMKGISRELMEELGVDSASAVLSCHAVFQSNSRPNPWPRPDSDAAMAPPATRPSPAARGELVTTVLALGVTKLTPAKLRSRRSLASPSKGAYESRGLVFVPMDGTADDFATRLLKGRYCPECSGYVPEDDALPPSGQAGSQETWGCADPSHPRRAIEPWLDQPALVSAIYACARVFSPEAATTAFCKAMGDLPWWLHSWGSHHESLGLSSRVVRPPTALWWSDELADGTEEPLLGATLDALFPRAAAIAMVDGMPRTLRLDAAHFPDAGAPGA